MEKTGKTLLKQENRCLLIFSPFDGAIAGASLGQLTSSSAGFGRIVGVWALTPNTSGFAMFRNIGLI